MYNLVVQLPATVSQALGETLKTLFIPNEIIGYDFMIDTLKQKIPAFFTVSETLSNVHATTSDDMSWSITLPAPLNITVPMIDFTYVQGFLSATRLLIQAMLYLWLAQYLLEQFNVKFNVG